MKLKRMARKFVSENNLKDFQFNLAGIRHKKKKIKILSYQDNRDLIEHFGLTEYAQKYDGFPTKRKGGEFLIFIDDTLPPYKRNEVVLYNVSHVILGHPLRSCIHRLKSE